jgi:hypothetical protein
MGAMSRENVERWRVLIEEFLAANREDDWEPWLAKLSGILAPDAEWDASAVRIPGLGGVYHGRERVVRWWRDWLGAWEAVEFDYELVDAGDRVVFLVNQRMRGRATGIEVELGEFAQLATFEDGLMTHCRIYGSHAAALEAAGLEGAG